MLVPAPLFVLLGLSSAHFILLWPPTAGFDDDLEATAPCGSFHPVVNSSSPEVQVDRFAISIENVHPVGQWSFRGTTDTEPPFAFEEIVPLVNTMGIGDFCLDYMTVPSAWAGKPGVLQIVDNSPDGILYQCAAVNFVAGSNSTLGSACQNHSAFTATWTNFEGFEGEKPAPKTTGAIATHLLESTSMAATAATSATSSSSSGIAAAATAVGGLIGGLGFIAAGLVL